MLCTDKTGTLTMNQMIVTRLSVNGTPCDLKQLKAGASLSEMYHELAEFGILASQRYPFDPMEKAIHAVGKTYLFFYR